MSQLQAKARETASRLSRSGSPTESYSSDDGRSISGWVIRMHDGYRDEERFGARDFRESWGGGYDILTENGEMYQYAWHYQDQSFDPKQTRQHKITPLAVQYITGEKLKDMINRLDQLR